MILLRPNPIRGGLILLLICIFISLIIKSNVLTYLVLLVYVSGILIILLYLTNLVSNLWLKPSWLRTLLLIILVGIKRRKNFNSFSFNWEGERAFYLLGLLSVIIILTIVLLILTKILKINLTLRNF